MEEGEREKGRVREEGKGGVREGGREGREGGREGREGGREGGREEESEGRVREGEKEGSKEGEMEKGRKREEGGGGGLWLSGAASLYIQFICTCILYCNGSRDGKHAIVIVGFIPCGTDCERCFLR